MPFSREAGFGATKPSGTPCHHLRADDRCGIHATLREDGWPGCTVFDCFGAGQQVSQVTYGGVSWRQQDNLGEMAAVLSVMRQLHEMLLHLTEAEDRVASVTGDLRDRIRGLDEGADDYVVKPFALGELLARIRVLLRRDTVAVTAVLELGEIVLDDARSTARRGARELRLTRKEFGVLRYLMTRPEHVISAEELLYHVWDENADPFTQTVRVTVGTRKPPRTAPAPWCARPRPYSGGVPARVFGGSRTA